MGHTVSNETPLDAIAGIVKTASEAEPDKSWIKAGVDSGFVARIQTGLVVGLGAGDDQTKQLKQQYKQNRRKIDDLSAEGTGRARVAETEDAGSKDDVKPEDFYDVVVKPAVEEEEVKDAQEYESGEAETDGTPNPTSSTNQPHEPHLEEQLLMRPVLAVDPNDGTMMVGDVVRPFQKLQFHVRDAESARTNILTQM